MTTALRPWPTSICKNPGVSEKLPSAQRLSVIKVYCPFHTSSVQPNATCTLAVDMRPCQFCSDAAFLFLWLLFAYFSAYLTGRHELQRAKRRLHVWDVGLELVESGGNVALDLIWLSPRWTVGRDLVQGLLRHLGRLVMGGRCRCREVVINKSVACRRKSQ